MTSSYRIRPIDSDVLVALRVCDDAGHAPRVVTMHGGGSPLRCCLRPSRPDEPIALASYAPLRRWARCAGVDPGAYDEVGPVFIHPQRCDAPADDGFPAELFQSRRVLRAYGADGAILRGRLVEPSEPAEAALEEMFSDAEVVLVHVRAVEFGCFTLEARRDSAGRQALPNPAEVPAAALLRGSPTRSRRARRRTSAPLSSPKEPL